MLPDAEVQGFEALNEVMSVEWGECRAQVAKHLNACFQDKGERSKGL